MLLLIPLLLSSCVYGNQIKQQNAPAAGEFINVVQGAVDQYIQHNGVPPIQNKEADTPIYEKYLIDFNKLINYNMISTIPSNAFENGGTAIYVLVNIEAKPQVKLMDLTSYQQMVDLQREVDLYIKKTGQLPKGDAVAEHFYLLAADKFAKKKTQIQSPYSHQLLNVVIHDTGRIALDYTPELLKAMNKSGLKQTSDIQMDLRSFLVEQAFFVPAWSYPYRWKNDQPMISEQ
jgi:urocanate hydratase